MNTLQTSDGSIALMQAAAYLLYGRVVLQALPAAAEPADRPV